MEKSENILDLAVSLTKFQSQVGRVAKDGNNPYFKSKYATLENVISTIQKPLSDNGLSFSQFPTGDNELSTILMHTSGQWLKSTCKLNPKDNTPQGVGSAITYMRRYALSAVLGIATEDDDDGNLASKPTAKKPIGQVSDTNGQEKTISYDEKPSEKVLRDQQAVTIAKLSSALGYKKTTLKKDIEKDLGLPLVEENFEEIIGRLQVMHSEKMVKKNA